MLTSPRDGRYRSEQHVPLFLFLDFFLSLSLCADLKYSKSSGCATWTKATCQGLSTCLATSTPSESWGVSCSEAMAETFLVSLSLSLCLLFLSLSQTDILPSYNPQSITKFCNANKCFYSAPLALHKVRVLTP